MFNQSYLYHAKFFIFALFYSLYLLLTLHFYFVFNQSFFSFTKLHCRDLELSLLAYLFCISLTIYHLIAKLLLSFEAWLQTNHENNFFEVKKDFEDLLFDLFILYVKSNFVFFAIFHVFLLPFEIFISNISSFWIIFRNFFKEEYMTF